MLDACLDPATVVEATLQPVRRYGVDAAILFSDIVVPLLAVGVDVHIEPGVGPVIAHPIRDVADLAIIGEYDPSRVAGVSEAVALLVAELGATPLIGFAGAPFTLASYLIEGGPSKAQERTRALMRTDETLWHRLLDTLADIAAATLVAQVDAGAACVQLFDSWVGVLSPQDYDRYVAPHSAKVLASIAGRVPRIHFGVGTGELLGRMGAVGADVVGVDWRVPLDEAAGRVAGRALQGNIDPSVLDAPWDAIEAHVRNVVDRGAAAPGHIVNLGHGVPAHTNPDVLARIVDLVHSLPVAERP